MEAKKGRPRAPEVEIDGVLHKECTECKEFKPYNTEHFYYNKKTERYVLPCKECRREYAREQRASVDVEARRAYAREYYARNRDKMLAAQRKYREANREAYNDSQREYQRQYRDEKREQYNEYHRNWRAANREAYNAYHREYYRKRKAAGGAK